MGICTLPSMIEPPVVVAYHLGERTAKSRGCRIRYDLVHAQAVPPATKAAAAKFKALPFRPRLRAASEAVEGTWLQQPGGKPALGAGNRLLGCK